jgi:hypothetical protein
MKLILILSLFVNLIMANELEEAANALLSSDYEKAEEVYTKLCNQGNFQGCVGVMNLGDYYLNGIGGIPKNYSKAEELLELSCETGGVGVGCAHLGEMYYLGLGVTIDLNKAEYYSEKACYSEDNYGNGQAYFGCQTLGEIHIKKGITAYKRSCDAGNEEACAFLKPNKKIKNKKQGK